MRPTHKHLPTESLVFPDGYPEDELELLPADYWNAVDEEFELTRLRAERDRRLLECDHPPLYERPDDHQPAWKAYRQALRDFPATADPLNPEWPEPPVFKL